MSMHRVPFIVLLGLAACYSPSQPSGTGGTGGDDDTTAETIGTSATDPSGASSDEGSATSNDATSQTPETTTATSTATSTDDAESSTGLVPGCGNGVVEDDEACDDGDDIDGNGCNVDCVESGTLRWDVSWAVEGNPSDVQATEFGDVLVAGRTFAQEGWFRRISAEGELMGDAIAVDRIINGVADLGDGSVATSGRLPGPMSHAVTRFLADGAVSWTQIPHTLQAAEGVDIVRDPATGELLATGTPSNLNGDAFWVGRYSPGGTLLWQTLHSFGASRSRPRNLSVDGAGEIALVGQGNAAATPSDIGVIGVIKLDGTGDELWRASFDTGSANVVARGDSAEDGAVVVAGHYSVAGQSGGWLRRYAPGGAVEWTVPYAELQDVLFYAVAASGDEAVVVGSVLVGDMDSEGVVRRYSAEGELLWERSVDATFLNSVDLLDDGDIVAAGGTEDGAWVGRLAP